eukprot:Skav212933  [mRNA]  locus=scaffold374:379494:386186:- [translate_table: standard]
MALRRQQLVGLAVDSAWRHGFTEAKPSEYRIGRRNDGTLIWIGAEDAVISNFKNIQNVDWGTLADLGHVLAAIGSVLSLETAPGIGQATLQGTDFASLEVPEAEERGAARPRPRSSAPVQGTVPVAVPRSPMDEIPSRQWALDDVADEDPVEFIIRQLENAKNLYEVLGVAPNASPLAIRQAYRAISLRVHPDKIVDEEQGLAALAEDAFKLASSAYEVLSDELERKAYDRELRADYLRTVRAKPKPKPKPPVPKPKPEQQVQVKKKPAFSPVSGSELTWGYWLIWLRQIALVSDAFLARVRSG